MKKVLALVIAALTVIAGITSVAMLGTFAESTTENANAIDAVNVTLDDSVALNVSLNAAYADSTVEFYNADGALIGTGTTCKLTAAKMADVITIKVKNGEEVIQTAEYSVKEYAENAFTSVSSKTKAMLKAMLTYGAAAQTYFDYNTTTLANANIGRVTSTPVIPDTYVLVANQGSAVTAASATLMLADKINIVVYLTSETNDLTVNVNGVEVETTVENGRQVVKIPVYPQDIDETYTIAVSDGSTIQYSAYTYIKNKMGKNETLDSIIKTIYDYNQAANAFVSDSVATVTAVDGTVTAYSDITAALAAVNGGATLTMWDDVTTGAVTLTGETTVDLNGFKFAPASVATSEAGLALNLKDSAGDNSGLLKTTTVSNCTVNLYAGTLDYYRNASATAGTTVTELGGVVKLPVYANVTYLSFELDSSSPYFRNAAPVTFDENGVGTGTGFPFRGTNTINIVDEATGEATLTNSSTVYPAYVDLKTGVIVRARNTTSFDEVLYIVPQADGQGTSHIKNAILCSSMLVSYNFRDFNSTAYIENNVVYFGVTFTDAEGNAIDVDATKTAPCVYVKDSSGNLLAEYGYNGTEVVRLDGKQGTYTTDGGTLVVSGSGTLTLNGAAGIYTAAGADKAYDLDVYLTDAEGNQTEYYQITLADGAYTAVKPMVTLTFECDGKATVGAMDVNVNIPVELPKPVNNDYKFMGWVTADNNEVADPYVPTEDVTLTAKWNLKVVVKLVGVLEGDETTLVLGEGDILQDHLPVYTIDYSTMKKFVCWYVDIDRDGVITPDVEEPIPEDCPLTSDNSGVQLIAKWVDLPPYFGEYKGHEFWSQTGGNLGKTINITENNEITGNKNGVVISYDAETQQGIWKTSATATTEYYFFYDTETGALIFPYYNGQTIGYDYYIFFRTSVLESTNGKIPNVGSSKPNYGVYCYNPYISGSATSYYAQFLTTPTQKGTTETLLIYNNHIYSNVTVSTAEGVVLTAPEIANASTVVVKNNTTGEIVFALAAAEGKTFSGSTSSSNMTRPMDAYFGTYTGNEGDIVLNGVGGVTLGGNTGTYTKAAEGSAYTFDVYMTEGENTVYYQLTVDTSAKTYTLEKPMVSISFMSAYGTVPEEVSVNMKVAYALPVLEADTHVFRGWYVQGDETKTLVNANYVPAGSVTLVAKWDIKYTFTIVYNNGAANTETYYGAGDTVNVDLPVWSKHKFDGWFTDDGTWANEWENGSAITSDTTIYGKWSDAPLYNQYYVTFEYDTESNSIEVPTKQGTMYVNPYGIGEGAGAKIYPHSYGFEVYKFIDANTVIIKSYDGSSLRYVRAAYDSETGMFAFRRTYGSTEEAANQVFNYDLYLMIPVGDAEYDAANVSVNKAATWNSGNNKLIEIVYGENKYNVYLDASNNAIYFNVSYKDMNGNAISIDDALTAKTLYIYGSDGELISMFGYNGTTLVELDGKQGVYTFGEGQTLELNGVSTVTIGDNTGVYTAAPAGSDYGYDVYMTEDGKTVYYKMTLGENKTATLIKPVVTLTFNSAYGTAPAMSEVNINVPYTLPADLTSDTHIFRGWYLAEDESQTLLGATYTPTENKTFVAKWDEKVTLTIVYGNGMETVNVPFGAGDTIDMAEYNPGYINGKILDHWYLSDDNGTTESSVFTATTITENVTVYCAWKESASFTLTNNGTYTWKFDAATSTWTSGNKGANSTKCTIVITALCDMTVSFDYTVSSEKRWDKFYIKQNDITKVTESGVVSNSVSYILNAGETLTLMYEKDISSSGGDDQVVITNFKVTVGETVFDVVPE